MLTTRRHQSEVSIRQTASCSQKEEDINEVIIYIKIVSKSTKFKDYKQKGALLGGGFKYGAFDMVFSHISYFHPYLGKIPNLTNIFQRGGTTNFPVY